jgi:hypothetical protein
MLADFLANVVAAMHIGYFLFVVGGAVSIVVGAANRWAWVRNPWFRGAHVASVYIVILEDVFGIACPLNTIESGLRSESVTAGATPTGVGGLLDFLLRGTIPGDVLDVIYWSLAVLLTLLLFLVPPKWR